MTEAVVFDLDGVLVDSETACYELAAKVVEEPKNHFAAR
jgi:beta-phosphoglucomutase-like phosphatase (HAD superfamily)